MPVCGSKRVSPRCRSYPRKQQTVRKADLISKDFCECLNMPHCSSCGCDLPGLQELCSECFEAKYKKLGHPKSLFESIRQLGSNPLRQQAIKRRINAKPWWHVWIWVVGSLLLDWRCAVEWFDGRYAFYSEPVLQRTMLIVVGCAAVVFLLFCVMPKARWRDALFGFVIASICLYGILSPYWIAHRPLHQ